MQNKNRLLLAVLSLACFVCFNLYPIVVKVQPQHESSIKALYFHEESNRLYSLDEEGLVLIHNLNKDERLDFNSYFYIDSYNSIDTVLFEYPYLAYSTSKANKARSKTDYTLQISRLDLAYDKSLVETNSSIPVFDVSSSANNLLYFSEDSLVHTSLTSYAALQKKQEGPFDYVEENKLFVSKSGDSYMHYRADSGLVSYYEWDGLSLLGSANISPRLHSMQLSPLGRYSYAIDQNKNLLVHQMISGELLDSVPIRGKPSGASFIPLLSNVNTQNMIALTLLSDSSKTKTLIKIFLLVKERLEEQVELQITTDEQITASFLTGDKLWLGTQEGKLLSYAFSLRSLEEELEDTTIALTDISLKDQTFYALSNDGLRIIPLKNLDLSTDAASPLSLLNKNAPSSTAVEVEYIPHFSQNARFADSPINESDLYLYYQNKNQFTFVSAFTIKAGQIAPLSTLPNYPDAVQVHDKKIYSYRSKDSPDLEVTSNQKNVFLLHGAKLYARLWVGSTDSFLLSNHKLTNQDEIHAHDNTSLILSDAKDLTQRGSIDIPFSATLVREYFVMDDLGYDMIIGVETENNYTFYNLYAKPSDLPNNKKNSNNSSNIQAAPNSGADAGSDSEANPDSGSGSAFIPHKLSPILEFPRSEFVMAKQHGDLLYIVTHNALYLVQYSTDSYYSTRYPLIRELGKTISLSADTNGVVVLDSHGLIRYYRVQRDAENKARLSSPQSMTFHSR